MKRLFQSIAAIALMVSCLAFPASANAAAPLFGQAAASGLVGLPDGEYVSPADIHAYIASGGQLTASMQAKHGFFGPPSTWPGGIHGNTGTIEKYPSRLTFELVGDGPLKGARATVVVNAECETHVSYQDPKADRRVLETTMVAIQGGAVNDPNFEVFEVVAGDNFGLPSPGTTILTRQAGDIFLIDSNFDIEFEITVKGRKGSAWEGVEDVVKGRATMVAQAPESSDAEQPVDAKAR